MILRFVLAGLAWALVISAPKAAADETLAEAAARERARREGQPADEVPSYGDQDLERLRKSRPKGQSTASQAPPSNESGSDTVDGGPDPTDPQVIARWQARAQQDRDAIARIEAQIAQLEQRVGELRAGGGVAAINVPNRERTLRQEIASTLEAIEQAQAALEQAHARQEETLEKARRAGIALHLLEQPPPPDSKRPPDDRGE